MSTYTAVRIEGGLLSSDFLETVTERAGQRPADFGLDRGRSVLDEATAAWGDARAYWDAFQKRLARQTSESPVTITREQWVIPLLEALGYSLTFQRSAAELAGQRYSISHRAGAEPEAPPVHIVGYDQDLGERNPSRISQMAPHALLQDYLNRTDHLWGVVTNGRVLRLLRNASSFTRPTYIEFDLATMFTAGLLDEFLLLYRLAHRTRLPQGVEDAPACLLEQYHLQTVEEGGRIREALRDAVEHALVTLGNGFLRHRRNDALREAVASTRLSPEGYYQELLYLIYRLLFLMVAEERQLLQAADTESRQLYRRYEAHLSLARLRRLAEEPLGAPQRYDDFYLGLRALFHVLREPQLCPPLGLAPLNGELFDRSKLHHLEDAYLDNGAALEAIGALSSFVPQGERVRRRVNYGALDVEELGSVYESLLDYQPVLETTGAGIRFGLIQGTERKSTGSYYTRPELVNELVRSALAPVIEARLAATDGSPEARQEALLDLNVCDPACGSGHFLLAAARRIGAELARVRSGEQEPTPEALRVAIRDAITHCVYGVDRNPLAVDLCKVALWIEGYARGKPLTFLDYRIRCGDSLVGVFDLDVLQQGIPDEAYTPVSGDDKPVARGLRDRNRQEREGGQRDLWVEGKAAPGIEAVLQARRDLLAIPEDTAEQVTRKRQRAAALHSTEAWQRLEGACDLWTAAFFAPLTREGAERAPTTATVRAYLAGGAAPRGVGEASLALAARLRFFHWPLEFPEALEARGGFDVVLGNPPWDMLQLDPQEFFATRAPEVANAANMAARSRLIKALKTKDRSLYDAYDRAQYLSDKTKNYAHASDRYPLSSFGRVNVSSLFAELGSHAINASGRAGMVLPTGIATNSFTQYFFAHLVETNQLASLYDFENREALFPGVHRSYKFSLLTLAGRGDGDAAAREMSFAFFLTHPRQLADPERTFRLTPEDFARINPNTLTCPIFRTRADAGLTRRIYRRAPVLVNEATEENPWGIRFQLMFMMNTDSALFRTREELEAEGWTLRGNAFCRGEGAGIGYLPLYEAKMIWQFDHRFSSYAGVTSRQSTHLPDTTDEQHRDPAFTPQPWYWVPEEEVRQRLGDWKRGWLLGFRRITNATNERTIVASLLPATGAGDVLPVCLSSASSTLMACLLSNMNALAADYIARQKVGGTHLDFHYARQLPVLPPDAYSADDLRFIVPRVLELVYTAWDLEPFADDVWAEADEPLRQAIRSQAAANVRSLSVGAAGGRESPPGGLAGGEEGLAPFRWDAERRAVLRAELDAYYARLYGLSRDDLRYILDPADVHGEGFAGETFRVLKEKEIRQYGEYRTRRLVLEAWDRL